MAPLQWLLPQSQGRGSQEHKASKFNYITSVYLYKKNNDINTKIMLIDFLVFYLKFCQLIATEDSEHLLR